MDGLIHRVTRQKSESRTGTERRGHFRTFTVLLSPFIYSAPTNSDKSPAVMLYFHSNTSDLSKHLGKDQIQTEGCPEVYHPAGSSTFTPGLERSAGSPHMEIPTTSRLFGRGPHDAEAL